MSEIDTAGSDIRAAELADAYARSFRDAHLSANGNTDCNASRLLLLNFYDAAVAAERERWTTLPRLPTPRVLASGTIAGKRIELRGWHTDDIEIWERQHGLKFGA